MDCLRAARPLRSSDRQSETRGHHGNHSWGGLRVHPREPRSATNADVAYLEKLGYKQAHDQFVTALAETCAPPESVMRLTRERFWDR